MTPLTQPAGTEVAPDAHVIGLVGAAHFVSHFYILTLAPLFTVVRADFGVTYTELGLALAAFNIVSALFQTAAGFLVDRVNARAVLVAGLLIGASALVGAATLPSFWGFVAMFALLGLGNTVYHPANYALLSRRISPNRVSQAYSIHTFAGMLGSAAAPASMLMLANAFGWRGAYFAAALLGFGVAAVLIVRGNALAVPSPAKFGRPEAKHAPPANGRLLLSPPILLNLLFFVLLALSSSGIQNFSVVALEALHGTPLAVSNAALSGYLAMSALGVLAGGWLAMRTTRHDAVAIVGCAVFALAILLVGFFDVNALLLILLTGIAGLCNGVIMPSRDMLVRAVTPAGSFGKVFGFVTTGFNIGGIITPLLFGWLLDQGNPRGVFLAAAGFSLITIATVTVNVGRTRAAR